MGEKSLKTPLLNSLKHYNNQIQFRMHMPGHKSQKEIYENIGFTDSILELDLTEVEGVDSLFHPQGSIKEAQKIAAELYGTKESRFLTNGASVGIIASIMSVVGEGDEIIVPRNAHRSVYNALILTGAKPVYLIPEIDFTSVIAMGIKPQEVEIALENHPRAKGVLLTHPNFYGLCSDIERIAKIVHKYNKILIVDEACGSHLKFHEQFPLSGIDAGADLIIHGTHKNLPALTQSGILHINSDRVDHHKLTEALIILQSSSPSYILLSSLEIALGIVNEKGGILFQKLYENINWFKEALTGIEGICIVSNHNLEKLSIESHDFSKVILNFNRLNIGGYQVESILAKKYGIQCELSDSKNILLTFTIVDSKETYIHVLNALKEIVSEAEVIDDNAVLLEVQWHLPELVFTPKEAWGRKYEEIRVEHCLGRVSMETKSPFPPAVPIIRPGERVDSEVLKLLKLFNASETIKVAVD